MRSPANGAFAGIYQTGQICENGLSKEFQTQFITSRQLVFIVTMGARLLVLKVIVELGREGWG